MPVFQLKWVCIITEISPLLIQLVVFVGLGASFQGGAWELVMVLWSLVYLLFNKDFGILRHYGGGAELDEERTVWLMRWL